MCLRRFVPFLLMPFVGCATGLRQSPSPEPGDLGVLVMAHGGDEGWNEQVRQAIHGLGARVPTALALGMANPHSLQAGLDSLAERGVRRVALVRLFLTGNSFLAQTEYFLGLTDDPPPAFPMHGGSEGGVPPRLRHSLVIGTHAEGLAAWHGITAIVTDRVEQISVTPSREVVFIVAHGVGDDRENDRLLAAMDRAAAPVRARGFHAVRTVTLREDWEGKRVQVEAGLRSDVERLTREGFKVLVVPYRLSGFGPYATVLAGLDYTAGEAFLPHAAVTRWIAEQVRTLDSALREP
ncbi:MAG TPA: hypothetical protein VGA37_05935 [Gemmatimonadales bacterium]